MNTIRGTLSQALNPAVIAVILVAIAVFRITSTYGHLSPTWDEPAHIARGMQWLDAGQYTYKNVHPPLAEILVAAGPYLTGARHTGAENRWLEGNRIIFGNGDHRGTMTAARLGTLAFFLLLCAVVYLWSRRLAGEWGGILSLFLTAGTPLVLAHSGLATNDAAAAAMLMLGLYAFVRYLERQTPGNALIFGVAAGLALATKFSAVLYLPLGITVLVFFYADRLKAGTGARAWILLRDLSFALVSAFLALWAVYRFPVTAASADDLAIIGIFSGFPALEAWLANTPLPLVGDFLRGVAELKAHNEAGHAQSFLGEVGRSGWWQFFPVVLLFTMPISLLLLWAWGFFPAVQELGRRNRALAPLVIAAVILLSVMPAAINIGTRHVLAIIPLLSVSFGYLLVRYSTTWLSKALSGLLLAGLFMESVMAHPDYLSYFNALAGGRPENIVVDSNLDWGQDLYRLDDALSRLDIEQASIAYNGSAPPHRIVRAADLTLLHPHRLCAEPPEGWAVISVQFLKLYPACRRLAAAAPGRRVGSSLFLYRFPGEAPKPLAESDQEQ
ncbi:MAG: glycosyltransferase family 39 protein [Pseudomonadota bacterium]